ncbi:PTS fructose transporter subunit IIC, partial [Enterococcus faecalis]|nr:PTS fructose transporter subunit IIC [Enterococcus faecalis]
KVEMERFDGKHLVNRPVSDGIRKTEQLINEAMSGTAPVFHGSGQASDKEDASADGSVGQRIYKDLMNGVSHMLPFV